MIALPDDFPDDRDDQAAFWCLSMAEGELTADERIAFDRWIGDGDNARVFDEVAMLWNNADRMADSPELIHARADALIDFRRANARRWRPRWPAGGAAALAAGLVALLAASTLLVLLMRTPVQSFHTGIGERRIAILEDGSRLSLDADTEVDVRLGRNRRELALVHGRAKFDVAKDPLRPFAVTAGGKLVVATGTSFSVEVLAARVHVLLYEGHVAVLDARDDTPLAGAPRAGRRGVSADLALTPGRELVAAVDGRAPAIVHEADPVQSLSWEAGQLSFVDERLDSAVARMNRYSREPLAVGDADAANIRINGVFTAGDSRAFVEGVTAVNALRADHQAGGTVLRSK